ncbi:isochorismate synthase [Halohasta litorea]|uniref:isochorismate synthase n=1 Tax=Halohasta litorea TaxID=869891 RepID=A0ABD6D8N1_9EURY|nr:isochorismate synthase [Halohasta litorea]
MESPRAADPQLISRSVRLDGGLPSFRAVLKGFDAPRTVWDSPGEATVIAGGAAATLTAEGPDRFDHIREAAESLFASGDVHAGTEAACPRLFGGFTFHADQPSQTDRAALDTDGGEPAEDTPESADPWAAFPDARFVFPRVQVTITDRGPWLTVNAVGPDASVAAVEERIETERERLCSLPAADPETPQPGLTDQRRTTTPDSWRGGVTAATDRIAAGDLQKVVLAQVLEVDLAADLEVGDILSRLGEKYPSCTRFLVEPEGPEPPAFFGATPERLVSLRGRTVETDALAGTTGRGETPAEDEWLADELLADPKNVHEHALVAETIREQLAPFAASVSTGDRQIKRLATVQHIHTPITAELAADTHVLSLVEALHPTPAVGGLPPDRALETIRETEPFDRGWYAAPIGWIDAAGNGTFAVGLRSAVATRRRATLFAGVGIVGDSDPDREWDEVELKFRPILDELEAE